MRPFFLRIVRKGKRKHKDKAGKERQGKRTTGAERTKSRSKERKRKAKRIKRKANTPQAPKPPNTSRVQRPHKPREAREQYKPTPNKRNPLKTPLKSQIKPYLQAAQRGQSRKRQGTRQNGELQNNFANISKIARAALVTCTSSKQRQAAKPSYPAPTSQIYLCFLTLSVSQIPEKTPRHTK